MQEFQIDPKVVARLAEEKEDENWRFRSFLKGADLSLAELDALVRGHYEAVASQIDCCACGNCCDVALPVLDEADVVRLADGMALSEEAIVECFLVPEDQDGGFTFNRRPCPLLRDKCCTVYESRPEDCRSFPHLHKKEFVFRLARAVENCAVCPIVFNVFERLKADLWRR